MGASTGLHLPPRTVFPRDPFPPAAAAPAQSGRLPGFSTTTERAGGRRAQRAVSIKSSLRYGSWAVRHLVQPLIPLSPNVRAYSRPKGSVHGDSSWTRGPSPPHAHCPLTPTHFLPPSCPREGGLPSDLRTGLLPQEFLPKAHLQDRCSVPDTMSRPAPAPVLSLPRPNSAGRPGD